MGALFSLTLPTLRRNLAAQTIKRIRESTRGINYEIVVVSPHAFGGDDIVYVPETEQKGDVAAQVAAYKASKGDIIVTMTDDTLPEPDWLRNVEAAITENEKRYFPFAGGIEVTGYSITTFAAAYGLFYPFYPAISRRSLEAIGGYFDPRYVAHWADPDLGMRVWHAGGRCALFPFARLAKNLSEDLNTKSTHKKNTLGSDFEVFYDRWHAGYGNGFSKDMYEINHVYPTEFLKDNTFEERLPPHIVRQRAAAQTR